MSRKRAKRKKKNQMLTLRERLLQVLEASHRPLAVLEIAERLGETELAEVMAALDEMEKEGKVVCTRKKRYGLPEKMNLFVGTIHGHPQGYAFLIPDNSNYEDIFISKENLNGAMHNDRVIVRPLGFSLRGKRAEGEVIRILKRANKRVVGTFEEAGRQFGFVVPDEKRIGWDIFVPRAKTKGARTGDKVVVEITSWPEGRRSPEGKIVERFGSAGEPGVDILAIIKKHELPE